MSDLRRFSATLQAKGEGNSWVVLPIPFSVEEVFGSRGRVSVRGSMNGSPFRSSLFPTGDGTHHMMVNKSLQHDSGAGPGATVDVELELDSGSRLDDVPEEFAAALDEAAKAGAFFRTLTDSSRNEYARWIAEAKRPETRSARVSKAIERLLAGKRRVKD